MVIFMDKYFFKFQYGFRKSCSTQQCLIAMIEKWKSVVDSGKSFEALLADLSKAFDSLTQELLLAYGYLSLVIELPVTNSWMISTRTILTN